MFTDLTVILPCHSLDDFPVHHRGDDAEGLLAAWSALWHPALLAAAGKVPNWQRADEPPDDVAGRMIVVPRVAVGDLPDGYLDRARQQGAVVIEELRPRQALVAAALAALKSGNPADCAWIDGDPRYVDDFLALGFCHLQTEVLTRRMRYASHLDEVRFQGSAVVAAKAWREQLGEEVKSRLSDCYNALLEARNQFYAVDAYLIDITLVGSSTLGRPLREELVGESPRNVLLSAATLEQIAALEPDTLTALRSQLERGTVGLIGGLRHEAQLPLMTHEMILAELRNAAAIYDRLLGRRPVVFGSRQFALTPILPQLLTESGFIGTLHMTFDEGCVPQANHSKTRWQGVDDATIDALARTPLDTGRADSFLQLPEELGNTMDHDFVATLPLAHWAGYGCDYYHDLHRMAAYAPVLGKFTTVDAYFRETEPPGVFSKFSPDQYRTPYLQQAATQGTPDPLSAPARNLKHNAISRADETLAMMAAVIHGAPTAATLADVLPRASAPPSTGCLTINPLNFKRRVGVKLPELNAQPNIDGQDLNRVVVEVPPLGFAWITAGDAAAPRLAAKQIVRDDRVLANEFCEVTIHPDTGGIQSIREFQTRHNRLSQQIAIRRSATPSVGQKPSGADNANYTTMVADSIKADVSDATLGTISSEGRLISSDGKQVARFAQSVSLLHGSRLIELEIAISDVTSEFEVDPWNSYLACRFAWSEESAELRRSVHGCSFATTAKRLEATEYLEIVDRQTRTAILTGGLPYHRRTGPRMLDCLLRTRGETAAKFKLGIGVDVPHAWRAAQELMVPATLFAQSAPPPISGPTGWLFHVDAPNLAATHWSPLVEAGRVVGFRVRLLETAGRRGRAKLACYKPPTHARRTSLSGQTGSELSIESDAVLVEFAPYEWLQVESRW